MSNRIKVIEKNPRFPPISWRSLLASDASALHDLDVACKQADGVEWVSSLVKDAISAASIAPVSTQCAWLDRQIMAAGWVIQGQEKEGEQYLLLGGQVHPAYRRRGVGTSLLEWAEQRAMGQAGLDRSIRLVIRNESLTPDAHRLYTRAGFVQIFTEQMMVRTLNDETPAAFLPKTIALLSWKPQTIHGFYRAYADSFRDRPGFPNPPEAGWLESYTSEEEFLPDLSMLALFEGEPVGFVTCEIQGEMGWVSRIGVVPAWRRQGLASSLLAEALRRFRAAGVTEAGLHVNVNNPNAIRLYERLGFQPRLERTRYAKIVIN